MKNLKLSVPITPVDALNANPRNCGVNVLARIGLLPVALSMALMGCGQRGALTLPGSASVPSAAPPASSPAPAS